MMLNMHLVFALVLKVLGLLYYCLLHGYQVCISSTILMLVCMRLWALGNHFKRGNIQDT